jgi:hypothetical protein
MGDRSWMYKRYVPGIKGITAEFEQRVKEFIAFAVEYTIQTRLDVHTQNSRIGSFRNQLMLRFTYKDLDLLETTTDGHVMVNRII